MAFHCSAPGHDLPVTDSVPSDQPDPEPAVSSEDSGAAAASVPAARRSTRTWIIAGVVAVVVVVGAVTAIVLVHDSAAIHDGPGTATFTWTPVIQDTSSQSGNQPPQPFIAEINGHSVTGTASAILSQSSIASLFGGSRTSKPVPAFRYTGQFAGKPFSLVLSFRVEGQNPLTIATASSAKFRFTAVGTYGTMPVTAVVTVPPNGPTNGHPAHLTGSIGHWKVSADIPTATGSSSKQSATVHYVVSG